MVVHARPLRAPRTAWLARSTTRPFQQRTARGGRAGMAPTPAAHPSPHGRAPLAGRRCPLDLDPPTPPPSRRPGPAGAPAVIGPPAQRRQRRRLRITPNTNTSTTTMISTHNHVDMAASLVGAGAVQADTTAAHPSKQLLRVQALSWAGITAALRAGSWGPPAPRDLPADLGWPSGCQTGPAADHASAPVGPSPSGNAQPAQPHPHRPARQGRRTRQASTDPTRPRSPRKQGRSRLSVECPTNPQEGGRTWPPTK
jgi:hypothetical protein